MLRNDVLKREWDRFLTGDSSIAPGIWAVVMFRAWQMRWLTTPHAGGIERSLPHAKTGRLDT